MKPRASLPADDVQFPGAYEDAWNQWAESADGVLWNPTIADGLDS